MQGWQVHESLLATAAADQAIRGEADAHTGADGTVEAGFLQRWHDLDAANTASLVQIVAEHGWPGHELPSSVRVASHQASDMDCGAAGCTDNADGPRLSQPGSCGPLSNPTVDESMLVAIAANTGDAQYSVQMARAMINAWCYWGLVYPEGSTITAIDFDALREIADYGWNRWLAARSARLTASGAMHDF